MHGGVMGIKTTSWASSWTPAWLDPENLCFRAARAYYVIFENMAYFFGEVPVKFLTLSPRPFNIQKSAIPHFNPWPKIELQFVSSNRTSDLKGTLTFLMNEWLFSRRLHSFINHTVQNYKKCSMKLSHLNSSIFHSYALS